MVSSGREHCPILDPSHFACNDSCLPLQCEHTQNQVLQAFCKLSALLWCLRLLKEASLRVLCGGFFPYCPRGWQPQNAWPLLLSHAPSSHPAGPGPACSLVAGSKARGCPSAPMGQVVVSMSKAACGAGSVPWQVDRHPLAGSFRRLGVTKLCLHGWSVMGWRLRGTDASSACRTNTPARCKAGEWVWEAE